MRGVLLDPPLISRAAPLANSEETQRLSYVPAPSLWLGPWARARGPGPRYRGAPGCPALQQRSVHSSREQRSSNVRRSVYPRDAPIVRTRLRTFELRCYVVLYQSPSVPDRSGCWIATPRLVTPGRSRLCDVQTRGFAETQLEVTQKSTQKSDCVRSRVQRRPEVDSKSRTLRATLTRPVQGRCCPLDLGTPKPAGTYKPRSRPVRGQCGAGPAHSIRYPPNLRARSRPVRGLCGPLDPGTPRPADGTSHVRGHSIGAPPDLQWRPLATSGGCARGSGGRGNPRRLAAWWMRSRVLSRMRAGCR